VDLGPVEGWIAAFSYPAVLVLLVLAGFGAPVSEELVLLAGGIVTATQKSSLPLMAVTAWVGVLAGDSALFRIGQKLGPRAARLRSLRRVLSTEWLERVNHHFARHGALTIFVVRFCTGLRAPAFVAAGMSGMRYRRFLLADALAAAIHAPLLVWIGWRFGAVALDDVKAAVRWILIAILALAGALLAARAIRRRRRDALAVGVPPRRVEDST
jgi:membrane protein DedA with SNARE-associated domain